MLPDPPSGPGSDLFVAGGEAGRLMAAYEWADSPLGPVDSWPAGLRHAVRTVLVSKFPMVLTWGPDFTQIYNDAYSKLIGDRHPAGLGNDIRITLAEAWDVLGPMIHRVMETGAANWTAALRSTRCARWQPRLQEAASRWWPARA